VSLPSAATSARALWRFLRALTGDDAYERYVSHHLAHHGAAAVPSRREFYAQELQRKWSGINRCC
jgi:uncharacterized short protein YbdD (DUF466 family)